VKINRKRYKNHNTAFAFFASISLAAGLFFLVYIYVDASGFKPERFITAASGYKEHAYTFGFRGRPSKTFYITLQNGTSYLVGSVKKDDDFDKRFIADIEQGQEVKLTAYKSWGELRVLELEANGTTYVSYNDTVEIIEYWNKVANILGVSFIAAAVVLFLLYWRSDE
jgi:hypothetical protein